MRTNSRLNWILLGVFTVVFAALALSRLIPVVRDYLAARAEAARIEHRNYLAQLEVAGRIVALGGNPAWESRAVTCLVLDGHELSPEMGDLMARLPRLRDIYLYEPNDECLANLAALHQLEVLDVMESGVTDSGVRYLMALRGLKSLSLSHAALTDSGLQRLASMPNLRELRVYGTLVTASGVEQFKRTRPDLIIGWDGGIILGDWE